MGAPLGVPLPVRAHSRPGTFAAVRNLRLKLEVDPAAPTLIVNDLGIGYRLIAL